MINKVTLIGNLGKDPEIRHLENGTAVTRFSVATNESYQDKDKNWKTVTEWHDVILWRGQAERAERQLKKGSLVYIEGKLTHRKWQDKEGNDRYSTEVVANSYRSLDRRESSENQDSAPPASGTGDNTSSNKATSNDNSSTEEKDLPF